MNADNLAFMPDLTNDSLIPAIISIFVEPLKKNGQRKFVAIWHKQEMNFMRDTG